MPEVMANEDRAFEFPWSEEDFVRCLRQRNCIGMVAEQGESVVGFMIYELHKARLQVLNFAVDPAHRRRGVGRQMVAKLAGRIDAASAIPRRSSARSSPTCSARSSRACGRSPR